MTTVELEHGARRGSTRRQQERQVTEQRDPFVRGLDDENVKGCLPHQPRHAKHIAEPAPQSPEHGVVVGVAAPRHDLHLTARLPEGVDQNRCVPGQRTADGRVGREHENPQEGLQRDC